MDAILHYRQNAMCFCRPHNFVQCTSMLRRATRIRVRTETVYTKPVGDIVKKHNLRYHCYADDTQIYLSIKPDENWASDRSTIEACVADVGGWMNRNMLKLNQEKSELIVFSSKHRIHRVNDLSLTIGGRLLHAVQSVRNIGVIVDSGLTMEKQVNAISKSCFYHIRNIGKSGNTSQMTPVRF